VNILNLLSINELINDPFEAFATLDHVYDEHLLEVLAVLWNILMELLVATSNSAKELVVLYIKVDSLGTNDIKFLLNVHDWDGDVVHTDAALDEIVDQFILLLFASNEWNWGIRK
jgi:hypothetical protein